MSISPSHETPASEPLQGAVLYIEDEPICFALVEGLLASHPNVRLIHAPTGTEGIRVAHGEHPDVVLLDMHLPDLSGIEVVRRLSPDIAAGSFRVIVLTADQLTMDVLKAMSLGACEYLIKPVNPDMLESALARALAFNARKKPSNPPGTFD
ncbi:MAG: response regulator [Burkholderiales bacterium]